MVEQTGKSAQKPLLRLTGVGKAYAAPDGRALWVLRAFDFVLYPGELVAVVGASGSGKSTLMHLLGLLDTPTCGVYELLGQPVTGCSAKTLACLRSQQLGFVFQSFCLLPGLTAIENVELPMIYKGVPRSVRRQRAEALLTEFGLGHRKKHTPAMLSGGQQQRVAVARALANDPQIILADEPTGNLDPVAARELMCLLRGLAEQGRGVVVITHDPKLAALAHRTVQMPLDAAVC